MKPINGKKPFLAVPVPKDASNLSLIKIEGSDITAIVYYSNGIKHSIAMSGKGYTFLGTGKLSELTEEQAAELVDESGEYRCMYKHYIHSGVSIGTAKHSLQNLLKSNDCWLKEWIIVPNISHVDTNEDEPYYDDENYEQKLSQAAEDFLIIVIN